MTAKTFAHPGNRSAALAGLCRDCLFWFESCEHCPRCGSNRIVGHPELADLAIAHIDCDAFYAAVEKRDDPRSRTSR
ncbi:MAG: hypothetical protein ACXWUR_14780 [Allosphingosinicella sp.]